MTTAQKILQLEEQVKRLLTMMNEHTFKNEQPYKGTLTRGQAGKLGYEITVYAEDPTKLTAEVKKLQEQFDQFCGIAPADTTLSPPLDTSKPYNAGATPDIPF